MDNRESAAAVVHRPYVSAETKMTELTIRGLVVGSLLGIIFAASSVYLGLKVGLTVSASIPIAVLSITIFRAFGKATILENNIVQTTGSAGESLAAGVAFTLPSLLLMGFEMNALRATLVALLGGALGVLMMIPLRHGLIVKEHGNLTYPEGTACAEVLIVGEKGGTSARTVFGGLGAGALFYTVGKIFKFWGEYPTWSFNRWFKGGSLSFESNPALVGVGYIIGTRTSNIMMAGGVLSFLVLIPLITLFGPTMTSALYGATPVSAMSTGQIRNAFVLYIGAGAVAAGGVLTLVRSLPTIISAFKRGLGNVNLGGDKAAAAVPRTEQDLSMRVVLGGSLALVVAIAIAPSLGINAFSAVLIILFGFFFVTVSSRITGEIGSSSNPISGMTVATLLITCLLFLAVGWTGVPYKEMALCTAALVCVAASNGGTTSQDLKTGFLVGATPRNQQIAIMVGVLTSALVIGFTLVALNRAATTYVPKSYPGFVATPATATATGGDLLAFAPEPFSFRGHDYQVLYVRNEVSGVPRGKYLVGSDSRIAFLADPGVSGVEPVQRREDGSVEKVVSKFDAPKARLFQLIIDGVLERNLPWSLVLIGVFLALLLDLCGVSVLPFAVGAYLPLSTSATIWLGGIARWLADKRSKVSAEESESSPGVLFASGLIAGGALIGLFSAALEGVETTVPGPNGLPQQVTLLKHWGLELSYKLFGEVRGEAIEASATWSILPLLGLAALLYWVASRRPKSV
ncbi:MAG: OPT family oligopeptide transporter [Myxococcaceae bacterium]